MRIGAFKASARVLSELDGAVSAAFRSKIGSELTLGSLALSYALHYRIRKLLYSFVLIVQRPGKIVLTVAYGKEHLIDAARSLKIPVIELQHGIIRPHHMGYHFPYRGELALGRPNLLLLFGEVWKEDVKFSPLTKVRVAGNRWIDEARQQAQEKISSRGASVPKNVTERVLFISSQPFVGSLLLQYAIYFRTHFPNSEISVRKHPNQSVDYCGELRAKGIENVVVDGGNTSITSALLNSDLVVTGPSTVLFQALACGCKLAVVRSAHDFWLQGMLRQTGAIFVGSPEELVGRVSSAGRASDTLAFYDRPVPSITKVIDSVLGP